MKKNIIKIIKLIGSKLTFFDILFLSIIGIILVSFIVFFRRENTYVVIRVKVTDPNFMSMNVPLYNEIAYSFKKGDKEVNDLNQVVSEIVDVNTYRTDPNKQIVYVDMKVKAIYNPRKKQYVVKGKHVAFGQSVAFMLSKVKFEGIIVDFPNFLNPSEKIVKKYIVKAQLRDNNRTYSDMYGVPEFIANAIKPGDEIVDSQGNIVIKILDVLVKPANRTVLFNGQSTTIQDQRLKDVYYTLELYAYSINKRLYIYDYLPMYVGQLIPLSFSFVDVQPTILSIDESDDAN